MTSYTHSYTEKFFRVKRESSLVCEGNSHIRLFEFDTERNAKKFIKTMKFTDAKVIMVNRNITESVMEL
jgi:hypothetical protein